MVRPKKHLGQHFLMDTNIAQKIVNSLEINNDKKQNCLEIGPGEGVLTQYLLQRTDINLYLIEIDEESVEYLNQNYSDLENRIFQKDFLKMDLKQTFESPFSIIGNFPYNISSQIFFKVIENYQDIPQVVCMIQKEVAQRIASKEGNKTYGILSVLLQAFYDIEYLFTVNENVFNPPPKVKSGVIRLKRKTIDFEIGDIKKFILTVKTAFSHRRKTMRNNLKQNFEIDNIEESILNNRAEQLTVQQFVDLANTLVLMKQ